MIKKTLITLLTVFGLGLSFSNATVNGTTYMINRMETSQRNNQYTFGTLQNGLSTTDYLGNKKNILGFEEGSYFFRTNEGKPYMYSYPINYLGVNLNQSTEQGYITDFLICDGMNVNSTEPNNCTRKTREENQDDAISILKNTTLGYYGTFIQSNIVNENYLGLLVCYNNSRISKSVCFYGCTHTNCGTNTTDKIGGATLQKNLTNSKNYQKQFNKIPNNDIGIYNGANNGSQTSENVPYCPTIKQIMKNMGENYNTGLCYNGTLYYTGGSIQTIQQKDIFTIFNNYEEYTQRINVYRNNCNTPSTQQNCENAFNGEFEKYSIISNAINAQVDEKKLWNYCNLGLNYDPNATTCTASGYIAEEPTVEDIINEIANGNFTIVKPAEGTIYDTLYSGENNGYDPTDIRGNIDQIYGKITGMFAGRNGKDGIIPDIILWFGFAIILFTVLFKW